MGVKLCECRCTVYEHGPLQGVARSSLMDSTVVCLLSGVCFIRILLFFSFCHLLPFPPQIMTTNTSMVRHRGFVLSVFLECITNKIFLENIFKCDFFCVLCW